MSANLEEMADHAEVPTEKLRPVTRTADANGPAPAEESSDGSGLHISCSCPECGTNYDLESDCVGRKLSCGHCETAFIVLDESGRTSFFGQTDRSAAPVSADAAIRAKCPSCGKVYNLSRDSIGIKMQCAVCQQAFIMLDLTGQTSAISDSGTRSSDPAPRHIQVSRDGHKIIECACPKCGHAAELDDSRVGEKVSCESCHSSFMLLDLTGVTIPCDSGKGRKKEVVIQSSPVTKSTVQPESRPSSGWTAGSIAMAVICLILLVLAGIYLFHPSSPFNKGIGTPPAGGYWW